MNPTTEENALVIPVMPEEEPQPQRKKRTPLTHYTAAKAAAFLLFILMAAAAVGSVLVMVVMFDQELYTTPETEYRDVALSNLAEGDAYWIARALLTEGEQAAMDVYANSNITGVRIRRTGQGVDEWTLGSVGALDGNAFVYVYDEWYWHDGRLGYFDAFDGINPTGHVTVTVALSNNMNIQDEYFAADLLVTAAYALRYWVYVICLAAVLLAVSCFVFLMCASGRRKGHDGPVPGWGTRIPIDLLTAAAGFSGFFLCLLVSESHYFAEGWARILLYVLPVIVFPALFLGWCMSFALRSKLGGWWKNSIIFFALRFAWRALRAVCSFVLRFARRAFRAIRTALPLLGRGVKKGFLLLWGGYRWCFRLLGTAFKKLWLGACFLGRGFLALIRGVPMVWRTALIFSVLSFIDLFFIMASGWYGFSLEGYDLLWILGRLVLFAAVIFGALMLKRLWQAGEILAAGDLSHQVDASRMFWDFKKHGENLNSISVGMAAAVEQRLKSERMKTELITNVSHDIKTPLTSIINYADLIGREPCENEKITEYAGVLHRQSERLKRLIDDLVEASKASTGNLDIFLAPCEAGVLLTQAAGEYEQRLADGKLELITRQPGHPVKILADGRRLWRVIDNLMNNICKYAQSGTRVYLTLEEKDGQALLSFKNTSREALNVSEEELLERFVQGDAARKTEGNGLGLSIAKSLTELQNGSLALTVDGDLFKVVLSFPTI